MEVEKQREIIRLWNRMRRVQGPLAEEIRIQILECFEEQNAPRARADKLRAVMQRVPIPTPQHHREINGAA